MAQQPATRRRFLATAACAGSAWLLHPRLAWGAADTDPHVAEIVARTIGIDTHNHIDVPLNEDELPGPEHVAIGTDTKLTPAYHSPNAGGQGGQRPQGGNFGGPPRDGNRPEGPGGAGGPGGQGQPGRQNAPGGQGGGNPRAGERTNEAWQDQKTGFYYTVVEALLKVGFNEKEIGQIGGGNYGRLFDAATAGH